MKREKISSIRDIGLCIQTMIKNRFNKNVKMIYTPGTYNSLYVSFYKSHVWQFYIQDKHNCYIAYLLKNDKVVKKIMFQREESIQDFYTKILVLFRMI